MGYCVGPTHPRLRFQGNLREIDSTCYAGAVMPEEKPLTKTTFVAALKEAGVVTQKDLQKQEKRLRKDMRSIANEVVGDAADKILQGMDQLFAEQNERLARMDERLAKVEVGLSHVRDEVKGLKADLSLMVSRKEFNELKEKVERFHPTN